MAVEMSQSQLAELREQARAWLAENLPAGWMEAVDSGDGERWEQLSAGLDYRDWCIRLGEACYATPSWPAEYGSGLSLGPSDARVVNDVLNHYRVPRPFNVIGIGWAAHGPGVGERGAQAPGAAPAGHQRGDWCQLFSEPGAGSDVAGLSTRAVRDGDEWVVSGQKVWTTLAHISKWGMLLARTDPDVPKHKGLSYFVVDMQAPGVTVRPLVQITGDAEFNEVFFDEVASPTLTGSAPRATGGASRSPR